MFNLIIIYQSSNRYFSFRSFFSISINFFIIFFIGDPSISCTFTDSTCGWYSDNEARFNWARKEAVFAFNNTGPYVDHTNFANGLTSGGWLMSIETASHNPQDDGIFCPIFKK